MCFSTVRLLACRMMAISGFVFPLATQLAISLSRGVKPKAINGVVPAIVRAVARQNRLLRRVKIFWKQSHQLCVLNARIRRFTYSLKTLMC